MKGKIKLKPRTTYLDSWGKEVCIAGLAKCDPIEGQTIFWSIQGNWYAQDGRFVGMKRTPNPDYGKLVTGNGQPYHEGPYNYQHRLHKAGHGGSIMSECKDKESRDWWIDVKT